MASFPDFWSDLAYPMNGETWDDYDKKRDPTVEQQPPTLEDDHDAILDHLYKYYESLS